MFWTLCYEVQYYLFFVAGLIAWSSMRHRLPERSRPGVLASILAIPFALSLALHFVPSAPVLQGAALDYWFEFFTGALTYWVIAGRCRLVWLQAAWAAVALSIAASPTVGWEQLVPVGVSVLVWWVAARGMLGTFMGGPVLQYFGRRSYSLYLLHLPIGWRAITLGQMVLGDSIGAGAAWGLFLGGVAVSVVAAELMYRLVERPTIAWSKRVSMVRKPRPAGAGGMAQAAGRPAVTASAAEAATVPSSPRE